MKKKNTNPATGTHDDIELIANSIRSYLDDLIEDITSVGAQIEAERERNDGFHQARLRKLLDEIETKIDLFAQSKLELKELRRTNVLTPEQRTHLTFLKNLKAR